MCSLNQNAFALFLILSIFVVYYKFIKQVLQRQMVECRPRKLSSENKAYKASSSHSLAWHLHTFSQPFPATAEFPLLQQPQGMPPQPLYCTLPYCIAIFQFTHLHLSMTASLCKAQDYTSCPFCNKNTVPATWYTFRKGLWPTAEGRHATVSWFSLPGSQVVSHNWIRGEDTGFYQLYNFNSDKCLVR